MKRVGAGCAAVAALMAVLTSAGCAGSGGAGASRGASAPAGSGSAAATAPAGVSVPAALTVIASATADPSAVALAAPELAEHPGAKLFKPSARPDVVSVAYAGVVGTARYVDAYTVVSVCGGGIPDDCIRYAGAPEFRIPLASDAKFVLLGEGMAPNRPADFAAFRATAEGPDGKYDGNYDFFDVTYTADGQAASLTAEYTP
jgi:hypothetical protein